MKEFSINYTDSKYAYQTFNDNNKKANSSIDIFP